MFSFLERQESFHKYNYGNLLIIAGSPSMGGAAILCAKAAYKTGVGLVTVMTDKQNWTSLHSSVPEAVCRMPSLDIDLGKYDAIVFGPGIIPSEFYEKLLNKIISNYKKPLVIDAGGLNVLSSSPHLYKILGNNCILTPHMGEFKRLVSSYRTFFDCAIPVLRTVNRPVSPIFYALWQFCLFEKSIVVLKGSRSLVCSFSTQTEIKSYENLAGNPGMATAGSGDVLSGVLGSLSAQFSAHQNLVLFAEQENSSGVEHNSEELYRFNFFVPKLENKTFADSLDSVDSLDEQYQVLQNLIEKKVDSPVLDHFDFKIPQCDDPLSLFDIIARGVFLHSFAADNAIQQIDKISLTASDIVHCLSKAFKKLSECYPPSDYLHGIRYGIRGLKAFGETIMAYEEQNKIAWPGK